MIETARPDLLPSNFFLTCEHASPKLPSFLEGRYSNAFLASHRGYDRGALQLARDIGTHFGVPLFEGEISRLCVDLNRSVTNPGFFGDKIVDVGERQQLLEEYYQPFRNQVLSHCRTLARTRQLFLHLSVHSFARVLRNKRRRVDVGILFDPAREHESHLARLWQVELRRRCRYKVYRNLPYRGTSDGHTTSLRLLLNPAYYMGLELEVCQDLLTPRRYRGTSQTVIASLTDVFSNLQTDRS